MQYEDRLKLQTPEGVAIEVILAGAGSRAVAGILDIVIQALVLLLATWGLSTLSPAGRAGVLEAIAAVFAFVLFFFYFVLFETIWSGRSPGKRMIALRVLGSEGQPVAFRASMIRNLLRLVDFLPFGYGVAIVSIVATSRNQRLGDLAAGTIVVRDVPAQRRRGKEASGETENVTLREIETWDVTAVSQEEIALVRRFLERRSALRYEARIQLADELASRLRGKVGAASPPLQDELFLELLAAAKAARS